MKHELLIIIPAYNEEKNLPGVLDKMKAKGVFEYADVLVMNDASNDNTNWVAKAFPVYVCHGCQSRSWFAFLPCCNIQFQAICSA